MLSWMKSSLGILWNALLTASVVTLLAALFVAALPPVYRATAIVQGTSEDMLRMLSADFLEQVLKESKADTSDLVGWLEEVTSAKQQGSQLLQQKLFVSSGEEAGWINVTVEAQNADTAQKFANDIARIHSQNKTRVQLTPEEKAVLFMGVEAADEQLKKFMEMNPEVLRYTQERQNLIRLSERSDQQTKQLQQQLENFRQQLEAARRMEIGALTEPGVVRASQRLQNYDAKLSDLASRYGEQHRKMLAAVAERETIDKQLKDELAAFSRRLEDRIQRVRSDVSKAQKTTDEISGKVSSLDEAHLEYEKLKLERKTALARYEGMSEEASGEVFARAVTPGNTLGFNQALLLAFVFLVTFMLMAILMIVRTNRERSSS